MARQRATCSESKSGGAEGAPVTGLGASAEEVISTSLLETLSENHVHAEGSIFVAQGDDGNIGAQQVFDLDDLLLGGGHIGDVGDREVGGKTLLDGDARGAVLRGGSGSGQEGVHAE